jgi:sec-independent protein translocase protein TatA
MEETMFANLNGWHAVIILAVILLLFGAPKIPQLARSLGQSMRILKTEIRDDTKSAASDVAPVEEGAAR